ncbi:helix-turn-helix transcriptional regulator [Nocardia farcinica]|uniref:DUF5753 domain-containing protein n=3 Tax=Nocardia farcinica TaxID=37329 RepID=UPI00189392E6|nr:DUF5753 domain-containing protein [Nocardia farcinica]MBF6071913.1 helix-turn-helix transcriptional regulator [Nocardia farcinica]MBF6141597.1 helix-turn-helix transcriptional regulator [Nocardia farcinica]MBF6253134.1 helix-turn-helix transcriptional regulator [Nocardia farcinica]MBF6264846.1 helix-turn-helix transcriptional regulator [Nocardia farcinica]MBF6283632.1 helix-turn-helix transcriptional regulator [Nocardia farcinica]
MAPSSPTVARWELAVRFKQRLDELSIKVPALCKAIGFTPAYWSHVVTGRSVLSEEKMHKLIEHLDFPADQRAELLALRAAAKEPGWWNKYAALFGDELLRLYGLEHGAQRIRVHEGVIVPAMLQAPDYMRALMTSPYGVRSAVEADKYVEARMRRQKRLDGPDAVHFTAMLTEAVLLQHPWGPKVQIAQLRHIKSLIEAHPDTVDVRVIPLGAPECAALSGNVYLLDFESCWLPTVAWFENALFGALVEDPVQARNLNYVYNNVFAAMPDQGRSLDLIDQAVRTLTSLA